MVQPKRSLTVPPPAWWEMMATHLQLTPQQRTLFWQALAASTDPVLVALRYQCFAFIQRYQAHRDDPLHAEMVLYAFLQHVWSPRIMVLALETLHGEQLLSREDCTHLEECFLARCNTVGGWTTKPPEPR